MNFEKRGPRQNLGGQELDDAAKLECGVCWHVYDPLVGDSVWQVPAGTPFSALPEDWRCPNCDAAPSKFMKLADD